MADVIDINANKPHWTGRVKCSACGHEWIAVAPEGTHFCECPKCHDVAGSLMGMDCALENVIETWARQEYRDGVSPGAAARELCRTLGAIGCAPTLRRMLEELLADRNRASFDRSCILRAIDVAAPADASRIRMESFKRNNPTSPISGAGAGDN